MVHRPNPVQPIAHQLQQFAQQHRPPLPPMLGVGQQPQQTAEAAIQAQMHELALEIYARLAVEHISDDHYTRPLSVEHLHQLAQHSQTAARAYFEQLGVQFAEGGSNGQS